MERKDLSCRFGNRLFGRDFDLADNALGVCVVQGSPRGLHEDRCYPEHGVGDGCAGQRARRALCFAVLATLAVCGVKPAQAATPKVRFDMVRLVGCRDVTTKEFSAVNPDERLVTARLEVSSLIEKGDEGNLLQYFYQITSPPRRLQIADYQPRTTAASDYAGNVGVEKREEKSKSLGISVTSPFDHGSHASGNGELGAKNTSSLKYELVPPQESVAASGTMQRGYGVYFKLKRMRQSLLEGAKEFVVTFRAPRGWRADYLHVRCEALGVQRSLVRQFDEEVICGEADFLVALYLEGDEESKRVAAHFIDAALGLRRSAAESRSQIHKHNYPTVFHEFGALVGAVEPKISETWLSEMIYLSQENRLEQITEQLPPNVRNAARDYLVARDALRSLDSPDSAAHASVQR